MAYVGLGQTLVGGAAQCDLIDEALGTCISLIQSGPITTQCNWFESLFWPSECQAAQGTVQPVPAPAPPSTNYGSSPTPPAGYSATYSGTDSNGNPVYVYTPTEPTLQQQTVAGITSQVAANEPVDCTQWQNMFFNSACNCYTCQSALMWGGLGLLALLAFSVLKK